MFCSHFVLDLISKQIVLSDLNYSISFKFGCKNFNFTADPYPIEDFLSLQSNLT